MPAPMAPKAPEKPYLSPTQIDSFTRCGEAYRRRYIEKEIIPPAFAMIKGSAVHVGAEANFKQKIESKVDLPAKDIVDMAAASFDGKLKVEGVLMTEEEESEGKDKVLGRAKDSTVRMAGKFAEVVAPQYQPIAVEEKVRLVLPDAPRDILGIMDIVIPGAVQDLKTSAKAKTQDEIDGNVQFTTYAALYLARYGKLPDKIIIDNVIDRVTPKTGKTTTDHQRLTTTRGKADFNALAARINTVTKGIEAGMFMPATPGAWWCSAKSCGYFRSCGYVNSERKAASEMVG